MGGSYLWGFSALIDRCGVKLGRFDFVRRGIAPLVSMLSDRWKPDPDYGNKIMRYLQQLYGSV